MHVCPMVTGVVPHVGGPVSMGMPLLLISGLPVATSGCMCTCVGPPDVIAMGMPTTLIGGMPAAVIGSMTSHGGSVLMGLPLHNA